MAVKRHPNYYDAEARKQLIEESWLEARSQSGQEEQPALCPVASCQISPHAHLQSSICGDTRDSARGKLHEQGQFS
jgi:hypothetical protein